MESNTHRCAAFGLGELKGTSSKGLPSSFSRPNQLLFATNARILVCLPFIAHFSMPIVCSAKLQISIPRYF
jgi:hypothetical protein